MDGTLVDTHTYFEEEMTNATLKTVSKILPNKTLKQLLTITEKIINIGNNIYENQKCPIPVAELSKKAIIEYLNKKKIKTDEKELYEIIKSSYKEFYLTSPMPYSYTISALHKITEFNIPIGIYSHAQEGWTKVKVEKIRDDYFKKYNEDIKIPFFTTPISDLKDKEGWIKAGKYHNTNLQKTLVVGDNLLADIYAAIDAGYKYLAYLSHSNKPVKIEKRKNAKIFVTKNLKTIFS